MSRRSLIAHLALISRQKLTSWLQGHTALPSRLRKLWSGPCRPSTRLRRGEDPRTVLCNRYCMLEVSSSLSIDRHDCPFVRHCTNARLSNVHHRLDRDGQAWNKTNPTIRLAIIRNLRLFVESRSDSMTHQIANYAESRRLDNRLHVSADITEVIPRLCNRNTCIQSFTRYAEQTR